MSKSAFTYRQAAAEGSSGFALLIALYDTLAGNLRRAADAQRFGDIEIRCREVNHALLTIGYLENWIQRGNQGDLAGQLLSFYSNLRRDLIQAQAKQSAELLEQKMTAVLSIRQIWQDLELSTTSASPQMLRPGSATDLAGGSNGRSWSA